MHINSLWIGLLLALLLISFSKNIRFGRETGYHFSILVTVSSYYVVFSCVSGEALIAELFVAFLFVLMALAGALNNIRIIGLGIFLHGVFDVFHHEIISNSGVPDWWPTFCATFDFIFGLWVMVSFNKKIIQPTGV
jgi:uncharacterized membrane protein HdeD (DUF308 family)